MVRRTQNELILKAKELSSNPTRAEKLAMALLREKGIKFRYQQVFGFYILDFFIPELLLVVEIDGLTHYGREINDSRRDRFCNECGLRVLRVKNEHVSLLIDRLRPYLKVQEWQKRTKLAQKIALDKFNNVNRVKRYRNL